MSVFAGERRLLHAANYRPRHYWLGTAAWLMFFTSPIVPGWLIGQLFNEFQRDSIRVRAWFLVLALAVAECAIVWGLAVGHRVYVGGVESSKALLRSNVLNAQLASGGSRAAARNVPIGDVLVRLREDPFDLMFLIDNWVDLVGSLLYGSVAGYLLFRIDPWAALAGAAPMILTGWGNVWIAALARRFRERAREASSAVSDFLNAAFEASLTVKVAGAQPGVLRRLGELNQRRSKAAVGDGLWNEVIWTVNGTIGDVFVGVALLVAARGSLTAGEVSQFAAYLTGLVWIPMRIGNILAGRRRYEVSADRVEALLGSPPQSARPVDVGPQSARPVDVGPQSARPVDVMVEHRSLPVLGGAMPDPPERSERIPLETLEIVGLTVASRGLEDINLRIERGSLTVVSGVVGAGKTSLLRAVGGLIELDRGEVRWNGRVIEDRAAFFVPPQCAYVAQVPRLFAESLADNLRLGHRLEDTDVHDGIRLAVFDEDVAELPEGLLTTVGARGVRLSGGQVQRAAAARALAHKPELLVLDDLTSALDVETEARLWEGLAAAGYTVLAASNRPLALERADQILHLR